MSDREKFLAHARSLLWRTWSTSSEELGSAAVDTLMGLGMLVPEGGAAELVRLRARVAELEAERHSTNEALSDAAEQLRRDRDRFAELETERIGPAPLLNPVAVATSELVRADHFTEAARLLEDTDRDDDSVNLLDQMASGIRELAVEHRPPLEDPHDSPLHHPYLVGRDLPEYPHA